MSSQAVFQGNYCDLKFIRTRGQAQVVIEFPIERAAQFVAAFGVPVPGTEFPVAIARLEPKVVAVVVDASTRPDSLQSGQRVEVPQPKRRTFHEMPMSSQAAMRCDDLEFRTFLRTRGFHIDNADDADAAVKELLAIKSKKEIIPDTPFGRGWIELDRQFRLWLADSRR